MEPDQVNKLGIQSIDHIVMQASDLPETIKFYTEILGMTHSEFQPPAGGSAPVIAFWGAEDQFT